ncbi:hypothetical protein HDU97_000901 [Phlyctochytrium planicorne]|nr:hypothetical protein HDU97_000901 [Phlyctochytrium planicorne]
MGKRKRKDGQENQKNDETLESPSQSQTQSQTLPPIPPPPRCQHYIVKKKRYCPLFYKKGKDGEPIGPLFCIDHMPADVETNRIPCPFDPGHGVYKADLERHMRICNSRPPDNLPPYHIEDVNLNKARQNNDTSAAVKGLDKFSSLSEQERSAFLNKIVAISKSLENVPRERIILAHPILASKRNPSKKHTYQQSSLLGHMENLGALTTKNVFLELGAGKAELSHFVHMAVGNPTKFILIDRKASRLKVNRKKLICSPGTWNRIQMDLKDFEMGLHPLLLRGEESNEEFDGVFVYSKHLCGAATDLSLSALGRYFGQDGKLPIRGILIALCCHHLCSLDSYVNLEFIAELGIELSEFSVLHTLTSWATCGWRCSGETGHGEDEEDQEEDEEEEEEEAEKEDVAKSAEARNRETERLDGEIGFDANGNDHEKGRKDSQIKKQDISDAKPVVVDTDGDIERPHPSGLSQTERENIGLACKHIINVGRLRYLQGRGMDARLIQYCDREQSLENIALICEYKTGKTLGQGSYATVKEAIQIKTGERFAVKVISKKLMQGREHMILNEIEILKKVSKGHKNIVTLHDYFETPNNLYLVMDLCTGGELFDRICEKGSFYEEDAAEIVRTVVDAVAYLHDQNIVHRDIKPENLLFRTKESLSELVIADFGLSKIMDPETYDGLMTTCGTPGYMAPEVIKKTGHGRAVDLWSIGVLSYFLLCGYTPFDSNSSADELQRILTGSYSFEPTEYWQEVSDTAKDFIRNLLIVDYNGRLTARRALAHPWLAQLVPMQTEEGAPQQPTRVRTVDLLPNVKARFDAKRMFKKAIGVVKAINKLAHSPNVSQENLTQATPMSVDDNAAAFRPKEDDVGGDGILRVISRNKQQQG